MPPARYWLLGHGFPELKLTDFWNKAGSRLLPHKVWIGGLYPKGGRRP